MENNFSQIMEALKKGEKDEALDIFSNSSTEEKLDVIFALLTDNK